MNGEFKEIGDDDLLDYVIEKDFDDTVGRVILNAVRATGEIGEVMLTHLLRGRKPYMFKGDDKYLPHYGKLQMLSQDEILDYIACAVRKGFIVGDRPIFNRMIIQISPSGDRARFSSKPLGMRIPWPLENKKIPEYREFRGRKKR